MKTLLRCTAPLAALAAAFCLFTAESQATSLAAFTPLVQDGTVEPACANNRCKMPGETGCPTQAGTYCATGWVQNPDGEVIFTCQTQRCASDTGDGEATSE